MKTLVTHFLFAYVVILLAIGKSAPVLGGFDSSRGGDFSLESGVQTANLRTNLATAFPGITYRSNATLTPAFLSTIDVLFISVPFDPFTAIVPLSSTEQTALFNFVNSGHGALLFADNQDEFEAAGDSMGLPFGVDTHRAYRRIGDRNGDEYDSSRNQWAFWAGHFNQLPILPRVV